MLTPRVRYAPLDTAAGRFVQEEGFVSLEVGTRFFEDVPAACAILAHEVCHYVLEQAGVRGPNRLATERLTDLCMFILGFGPLFLAGYRRPAARGEYRPGHRLGYLSDDEYQFADRYVLELRSSGSPNLPSQLEALHRRLASAYPDVKVRERLLAWVRERHPGLSPVEQYELLLEERR